MLSMLILCRMTNYLNAVPVSESDSMVAVVRSQGSRHLFCGLSTVHG